MNGFLVQKNIPVVLQFPYSTNLGPRNNFIKNWYKSLYPI